MTDDELLEKRREFIEKEMRDYMSELGIPESDFYGFCAGPRIDRRTYEPSSYMVDFEFCLQNSHMIDDMKTDSMSGTYWFEEGTVIDKAMEFDE